MLGNAPLTLDDDDPRATTAEAAEKQLYAFYGIARTVRHIVLPRHGIRVRITETGAGDPVVIVPGNTGDGFPFIPLLPHLPGRRIITINRPGGGLSEGMDHTTVDFHDFAVETLTTVFDALALDRAPIIAHSMGGHWSQWFAIARPERVTALALLGVPGNVLTTCPTFLLRMTTFPGLGKFVGRLSVPEDVRFALNGLKIIGHSAASIARQPTALAEAYYRFSNLPHYLISTVSLMRSVNRLRGSKPRYRITAEQLVAITRPVLYLWGTHDPFGSVETGPEDRRLSAGQRVPHCCQRRTPPLARRARICRPARHRLPRPPRGCRSVNNWLTRKIIIGRCGSPGVSWTKRQRHGYRSLMWRCWRFRQGSPSRCS